jgi:hypothetical protein
MEAASFESESLGGMLSRPSMTLVARDIMVGRESMAHR